MEVPLLNLEKGLLELLEGGEMTEEDILRQVKGLLDGLEGAGYLHALVDGFCHHHDSRFHGKRYYSMAAKGLGEMVSIREEQRRLCRTAWTT